jgi:hypothetical protein
VFLGHAFARDQANQQVEDVIVSNFTSRRKIPIVEMKIIPLPFLGQFEAIIPAIFFHCSFVRGKV